MFRVGMSVKFLNSHLTSKNKLLRCRKGFVDPFCFGLFSREFTSTSDLIGPLALILSFLIDHK